MGEGAGGVARHQALESPANPLECLRSMQIVRVAIGVVEQCQLVVGLVIVAGGVMGR